MFLKKNKKLKIHFSILIFCCALLSFTAGQAKAAVNSGSITSAIKDMLVPVNFGAVTWTEELPASTSIVMELRSGNTATPDGTWTGWTIFAKDASVGSPLDGKRYVQYKATLNSDNINNVPSIDSVEISVYKGELISSPFNTKNVSSVLSAIGWSESKPGTSDVLFQMRTSADNSTWSSWCGPDNGASGCNSSTYFTNPALGAETVDADFKDGTNDKWVQYKVIFVGDLNDATTPVLSNVNLSYDAPVYTGSFISEIKNTGQQSIFGNFSWTDNTASLNASNAHASATVAMKIRAGNTATVDGSWTAWTDIAQGGSLDAFSGNQYIQYQTTLSTFDDSLLPSVLDVTIPYVHYAVGSHAIISSPYDARNYANLLAGISWNENVPTGTNVKFQMRTAPNIDAGIVGNNSDDIPDWANGSGWCGPGTSLAPDTAPENCAVTKDIADFAPVSYETTPTMETANNVHMSGNNDQWMQYIVWLETNSTLSTPILTDATLTYTVNVPPEVSTLSSVQGPDGKVTTTFEVRDADTNDIDAPLRDNVFGGLQYCDDLANCPDAGNGTGWKDASTLTFKKNGVDIATIPNNKLGVDGVNYTQYSVVWTPKTVSDYPDVYNANLKVRVVASDNAVANYNGYGVSTVAGFDTKDPTNLSTSVDHRSDKETVTINKAGDVDDSTYQLYLSVDNTFGTQDEIPLPSPITAYPYVYDYSSVLQGIDDGATVWLQVKDAKGNTNDSNPLNEIKAVIPSKPKNLLFYDISNLTIDPADYRELIAWTEQDFPAFESYNVVRCQTSQEVCTNEALPFDTLAGGVGVISDSTVNYFPNKDLTQGVKYYYKAFTKSAGENYSAYSNIVNDVPDGNGSSDSTPPNITNILIPNEQITTTSATITWTTDEISDSTIGYTLDDQQTPEYLPEYGNATLTTDHSITITGLKPNKTYAVRVKSRDALGNLKTLDKLNNEGLAPAIFKFTTKDGPEILGFAFNRVSNNEVSISWNTDRASDSSIYYSDTISNGELVITPDDPTKNSGIVYSADKVTRHLQTITNLTPGKKYYFYLTSQDGANIAIDDNAGDFYEFTTDNDQTDPIITEVDESLISNNQVAIHWMTDEPATSNIEIRKTGASAWEVLPDPIPQIYDRNHFVIVSGLQSSANYEYRVSSVDINNNEASDDNAGDYYEFKTLPDAEMNHPPLTEIIFTKNDNDEIKPSVLTDTDAVINFTTDQIATCMLNHWDTAAPELPRLPVVEGENSYNVNHSMHLSGLTAQKTYGYEVFCHDNIKDDEGEYTIISSSKESFTTTEKLYTESGAGALGDKLPPVINNVKVASTTGESATITWDTDENSNSIVRYGLDNTYGNISGEDMVNSDKANFNTSHTVILNGLVPATKYLFKVNSTDASGNIGTSAESTFTTASPSSLSSIKAESLNLGEAQITWNTSSETSSTVEYGLTTSYGEKKESSTLTKEHSISLSNLNQGVTYHYRVKGQDKDKKLYASSDQTFEPKSPPQVKDISVNDITEHEATISFNTNIPTTATVIYTNISDPSDNGSQADNEMATKHSIQIKNLTQGATFKIQIQARDEQGTESQTEAKDLTTGKDENPPKIDMVKTDLALAQNDKVQAIISWNTDEQSTTSILYKEGRNAEPKEINLDESMSTNHVAVITSFKPGTVYYFNTKSVDASGNVAKSTDYALLTPRRKENIIQIIIGNFTDIFGWAKFK